MKGIFLRLIRFYQKYISPMKQPTCSNYAIQAIERFGIVKGGCLALFRLLRCNPFSRGGYDPVPEKREKRRIHR